MLIPKLPEADLGRKGNTEMENENINVFPAHIRVRSEQMEIQSVEEHCRSTAAIAGEQLENIGLGTCSYLAGLLHDVGKYSDEFKQYIMDAFEGKSAPRGSVIHTFTGVSFFLKYHSGKLSPENLTAELLAWACGSHHGMFDCVDEDRKVGFEYRKQKNEPGDRICIERFFQHCATEDEVNRLYAVSCSEIMVCYRKLQWIAMKAGQDKKTRSMYFYLGQLARLLLSAVIEGDRRDTAEYMDPERSYEPLHTDWALIRKRINEKIDKLPHKTDIDKMRRAFSDICSEKATATGNLWRLNLPTGAGKTLTSLRYAIERAESTGKKRIIYAAPFLSILDQNAREIRNYIEDDRIILEHHSNLVMTEENEDVIRSHDILAESWDAPIIITTMVQLLNTLFSGSTACIRRYHSLCDSVIIFDEIQSLPPKLHSMFNKAVDFLATICNTTVVLCSATLPFSDTQTFPLSLEAPYLVARREEQWKPFKRNEIKNAGSMTLEETADWLKQKANECRSLLVVCNKKQEALSLYKSMNEAYQGQCFFLSAGMCQAHREQRMKEIDQNMAAPGSRTICISTQLIEAGVNLSFQCAVRICAGLDNIIQTAGRCNRHGESDRIEDVYIISLVGEDLVKLHEIQMAKSATQRLLKDRADDPRKYPESLDSDEAIRQYYYYLERMFEKGTTEYPCKGTQSLFSMLAQNDWVDEIRATYQYILGQAFKSAGDNFQVLDNESRSVLLPWKDGINVLNELTAVKHYPDHELLRKAGRFSINLQPYEYERLKEQGAIQQLCNGAVSVLNGYYTVETGYDSEWNEAVWEV